MVDIVTTYKQEDKLGPLCKLGFMILVLKATIH